MKSQRDLAALLLDACVYVTPLLFISLAIWAAGWTAVYVIVGVFVLALLMALALSNSGHGSQSCDDDGGWQRRQYDRNPATGLPMVGGVDTGGSPFGCNNDTHWQ